MGENIAGKSKYMDVLCLPLRDDTSLKRVIRKGQWRQDKRRLAEKLCCVPSGLRGLSGSFTHIGWAGATDVTFELTDLRWSVALEAIALKKERPTPTRNSFWISFTSLLLYPDLGTFLCKQCFEARFRLEPVPLCVPTLTTLCDPRLRPTKKINPHNRHCKGFNPDCTEIVEWPTPNQVELRPLECVRLITFGR